MLIAHVIQVDFILFFKEHFVSLTCCMLSMDWFYNSMLLFCSTLVFLGFEYLSYYFYKQAEICLASMKLRYQYLSKEPLVKAKLY